MLDHYHRATSARDSSYLHCLFEYLDDKRIDIHRPDSGVVYNNCHKAEKMNYLSEAMELRPSQNFLSITKN